MGYLKDASALLMGLYAMLVFVSYQVISVTLNIGNIGLGGQIQEFAGVPISFALALPIYALIWFVRRSRKSWRTVDKAALGVYSVVTVITLLLDPLRELVFQNPVVGFFVGLIVLVTALIPTEY
jgi:hypothetical protein